VKKHFKKIFVFILLLVLNAPYNKVFASTALEWLKNTGSKAGYPIKEGDSLEPKAEFAVALGNYVTGFILLMGPLYIIIMLYAGYLWGMSRGDESQVNRAKKIIIWSTAGMGVIILARIAVEFIIISLGSATITSPAG